MQKIQGFTQAGNTQLVRKLAMTADSDGNVNVIHSDFTGREMAHLLSQVTGAFQEQDAKRMSPHAVHTHHVRGN